MGPFGPPPPGESPGERRLRRLLRGLGIFFLILVFTSLAVLFSVAIRSAAPEEQAQPIKAQTAARDESPVVPAYTVADEFGSFSEPEAPVLTTFTGKNRVRLAHLWESGREIEVPVVWLRLVNPSTLQSAWGSCVGRTAKRVGRKQPRNRLFYRNPRIACAAYTAYIHRQCKHPGFSYSATAQYGQLRKRGWRLVASRVSTRYAPYFRFYRPGDQIFFHKGSRFGHTEQYVGNGLTSGTSSSEGRVAIRRVGNRGFRLMTVLRG